MSTAARHSASYIAEATFGTTPNTPALKALRHTAMSLALAKSSQTSEELRADRNLADLRHGIRETAGDIKGELSYGSFDEFLEASLCGTWTIKAAPRTATTISALNTDNSINDSANLLPIMEAGDTVTIAGFTASGVPSNGTFLVATSTASKLAVTKLDGTPAGFAVKAAGDSVTVTPKTQRLKNGVTRRYFSVLRYFSDISGAGTLPYHLFTGVEMGNLALEIGTDGMIGLSFSTVGKDLALSDNAPTGATFPAQTYETNSVMNANSMAVYEGGALMAIITEAKINLENGLEAKKAVGSSTVISAATIGRCNVTGEITAYFHDATMLNKFINETSSSIQFNIVDPDFNRYKVIIPKIKYTGGQPDVEGAGEITLTMPFTGMLDPVTASTIIIDRCPKA